MNIQIKCTGMDLTDSIRNYVEKRIAPLGRFVDKDGSEAIASIEVGLDTKHHKQGDVYKAEGTITASGDFFRTNTTRDDIFVAIDEVREELERQMVEKKDKDVSLFRRGARSVKKMLKGLSKRNPFTSKY